MSQRLILILTLFSSLFLLLDSRKRNLHESQIHKMKLYGNSYIGYYYINLFVGSDFQRQTVIVDTGSSVTSFPCTTCRDECGTHWDDHFNVTSSTTAKKISCADKILNYQCEACSQYNNLCTYSIEYTEGSSMKGYFVEDVVIMGDELMEFWKTNLIEKPGALKYLQNESAKFVFGCTTRETNLIKSQEADGILGLGLGSNSYSKIPNIVDYTFSSHNQEKLEFSLCISREEGGFMSIGGYNTKQHLENQTYIVPMSRPTSSQFNIRIHGLKVDGEDSGLKLQDFEDGHGSMLDSGTTFLVANSRVYNAIMNQIRSYCGHENHCLGTKKSDKCYSWDSRKFPKVFDFLDSFPVIEFQLDNNFTYVWSPRDYFYSDNGDDYCLGIDEYSGRVLLGSIFMRNYDILFDRTDKEIHFTRADCDKYREEAFLNIDQDKLQESEEQTPNNETSKINDEFPEDHKNATDNSQNVTYNQENITENQENITDNEQNVTENHQNATDIPLKVKKEKPEDNELEKEIEVGGIQETENISSKREPNDSQNSFDEENSGVSEELDFGNTDRPDIETNDTDTLASYTDTLSDYKDTPVNSRNSSKIDLMQQRKGNEEANSSATENHLIISIIILGIIFLFALIAFIVIKIKKLDITRRGFGRVKTSSRDNKESSQDQEIQNSTDMKVSHAKDVYSIEDPPDEV